MRRREFLKYGAGFIALSAGGAATQLAGAQVPPALDVIDEFDYRGRHVVIAQDAAGVLLVFVNGRQLARGALARLANGKLISGLLPFQPQPTPRALVRSLLDNDGQLFIL
jgi:hypothetical protein